MDRIRQWLFPRNPRLCIRAGTVCNNEKMGNTPYCNIHQDGMPVNSCQYRHTTGRRIGVKCNAPTDGVFCSEHRLTWSFLREPESIGPETVRTLLNSIVYGPNKQDSIDLFIHCSFIVEQFDPKIMYDILINIQRIESVVIRDLALFFLITSNNINKKIITALKAIDPEKINTVLFILTSGLNVEQTEMKSILSTIDPSTMTAGPISDLNRMIHSLIHRFEHRQRSSRGVISDLPHTEITIDRQAVSRQGPEIDTETARSLMYNPGTVENDDPETAAVTQDCTICMDKKRNAVFIPCGHMATCYKCAKQIAEPKVCPICRAGITSVTKVYL